MNQNEQTLRVILVNGNETQIEQQFAAVYDGVQAQAMDAEMVMGEPEPEGDDEQAALWKASVAEQPNSWGFLEPSIVYLLLVSDIGFMGPDGKAQHKPSRDQDQPDYESKLEARKEQLIQEWQSAADESEHTVYWLISFALRLVAKDETGAIHASAPYLIRLIVQATFQQLPTAQHIKQTFNPQMNTGFELAEWATPKCATLKIRNNGHDDGDWKPLSQAVLLQIIGQKIIPPQILAQVGFFNFAQDQEIVAQERYQQVVVELSALA